MTPNNQTTPREETDELAQRREFVRRSMLRANRSIGAILVVVALLGGVLALVGQRARESQGRAEQAEHDATERLWTASLARARAENRSTRMGRREAALDAARMAAKLRPSMELRNEAITALSQRDFVVERDWKAKPNPYGFNFDPDGVFNSHVGFSPDGKLLFAAGQNAGGLWSTGDWKRRWLIPRPPMIEVSSMGAFSADGTLIAWNRGMLAVELLTISGETVAALDVEELGCVGGIRFAGDGRKLFVTGMEGRMLTIDIPVLRGQLGDKFS